MATSPNTNSVDVPAYLPFTTLRSAIQSLRSHGLPDRIDKTAWNSRSGADQAQILSAFRFFGLIDPGGNTQPALKHLVSTPEDTEEEKRALEALLQARYSRLFELNLKTATPGAVSEAIGQYGVSHTTKKRAIRFFLKAAMFVGVDLSPRLTRNLRSKDGSSGDESSENTSNGEHEGESAANASRPRRKRRNTGSVSQANFVAPTKQGANAMKSIQLPKVGGTLSITGTFNPFFLMEDERKLVYSIIDMMSEFERGQSKK